MAKIVQTEGRTSSLLECYAEVQPIFCKDTKKIETTIPFNSIFLFSTQRLSIRQPPNYLPTEATEHRNDRWGISSHRLHRFSQIRRVWHPAIPTQPPNYLPTEFTEHTETTCGEEKSVYICEIRGRLFSARSFCVFCEIRGRISSV